VERLSTSILDHSFQQEEILIKSCISGLCEWHNNFGIVPKICVCTLFIVHLSKHYPFNTSVLQVVCFHNVLVQPGKIDHIFSNVVRSVQLEIPKEGDSTEQRMRGVDCGMFPVILYASLLCGCNENVFHLYLHNPNIKFLGLMKYNLRIRNVSPCIRFIINSLEQRHF
jgi:hypothetical protein